jgi:hypothetical protein
MTIFTQVMKQHLMDGCYELQTKSKKHREIKGIS